MSGISLRAYASTAQKDSAGEIRMAKGSQDQALVNKGTFGNQVASFLHGIGEKLHIVQPDPTRAARQQSAVDQFKAALVDFYGQAAADHAIQQAGLTAATRLTGAQVVTAINDAKAEANRGRQANQTLMQAYLPPTSGGQPSPQLVRLASSMHPSPDLGALTPEQRQGFSERLQELVTAAGEGGRMLLDDGAMERLAKAALKTVVMIENDPALSFDAARQAKDAYVGSIKDTLRAVATGSSGEVVAEKLLAQKTKLEAYAGAEGMSEHSAEAWTGLMELGFLAALRELRADDPGLARKAQANALKPDGALVSLYSAADHMRMGADYEKHVEAAGDFLALSISSLVDSLDRQLSAAGATRDDDMTRLMDLAEAIPQQAKTGLADKVADKVRQAMVAT